MTKQEITQEEAQELYKALGVLICCPAFTGAVFEKDKESHVAWTLAREIIERIQKKHLTPPAHYDEAKIDLEQEPLGMYDGTCSNTKDWEDK